MSVVESETYRGHKIEVEYDENPSNPRDDDNLCEIHYHSSRYLLGDTNWYNNIEGLEAEVRQAKKQGDLVIPLYAYIHSGIALSLGSDFYGKGLPQGHARFDSGPCGFVILRREKMLHEYSNKIFTAALKKRVTKYAEGEIQTFQQYLNGEVYGYVVDDHQDSCWGYYTVEDAMSEAKGIIDWMVGQEKKKHFEALKTQIRNKVPFQYRTSLVAV